MSRINGGRKGTLSSISPTTTSGIWSLSEQHLNKALWPTMSTPVLYLIVGGGGGGGSLGGGGGGGGVLQGVLEVTPGNGYTVTIGAGGSGSPNYYLTGTNGGDSLFNGLTALGGGVGGSYDPYYVGGTGGSGGGSSQAQPGGLGTAGQGYDGGTPAGNRVGGGGGAGGAGGALGEGGVGLASSILGYPNYYAGGGGGGAWNGAYSGGAGGAGGGGNGSPQPSPSHGFPGTANTGGGGGGGGFWGGVPFGTGGAGGSGVLVLSTMALASATTGSPGVYQDGVYNIYMFTGSGSITF